MSIEPPRRGLKIDISVFAPSSPAVQPCSLSRLGRVPPCSSSIFPATNRTHPFIASIARADFSVCVRPSIRPLHDSYPCTPPQLNPCPLDPPPCPSWGSVRPPTPRQTSPGYCLSAPQTRLNATLHYPFRHRRRTRFLPRPRLTPAHRAC